MENELLQHCAALVGLYQSPGYGTLLLDKENSYDLYADERTNE